MLSRKTGTTRLQPASSSKCKSSIDGQMSVPGNSVTTLPADAS